MKLDRNINSNGTGKYAIVKLRKVRAIPLHVGPDEVQGGAVSGALRVLEMAGVLERGSVGTEDEFFVLKLKDRHAQPALVAYAASIAETDVEFAGEVLAMARRAGKDSPWCKEPD